MHEVLEAAAATERDNIIVGRKKAMNEIDLLVSDLVASNKSVERPVVVDASVVRSSSKKRKQEVVERSWRAAIDVMVCARIAAFEEKEPAEEKGPAAVVDECRRAMRSLPRDDEKGEFLVKSRLSVAAKTAEREARGGGSAVAKGAAAPKNGAAVARLLIAIDDCYYGAREQSADTPMPHEYFAKALATGSSAEAKNSSTEENPLLYLLELRALESERLFGNGPPVQKERPVENMIPCGMKKTDPVATPTLHAWRASTRTVVAREYSFAVPTQEVLAVLKELNPKIIECGAGTGYWAWCLRQTHTNVEAYDAAPPGRRKKNDYHGHCETWTEVKEKTADSVAFPTTGATLLVTYPPPGDGSNDAFLGNLAKRFAETSSTVTSNRLALVGEWRGDTASPTCLKILTDLYSLDKKIGLPNWGDTSAHLTIWRKKDGGENNSLDSCTYCKKGPPQTTTLYRCRLTCDVSYCSRDCSRADRDHHRSLLRAKCYDHLPLQDDTWNNPLFWRTMDLTNFASALSPSKKQKIRLQKKRNNNKKKKQRT